jgi:hypothetical protein
MKKTGIELIAIERQEQVEKHGRTIESDTALNQHGQLSFAAVSLVSEYDAEGNTNTKKAYEDHFKTWRPMGWDKIIWAKMIGKSYKERLIIAGALIAAEIDRLQAIEK